MNANFSMKLVFDPPFIIPATDKIEEIIERALRDVYGAAPNFKVTLAEDDA